MSVYNKINKILVMGMITMQIFCLIGCNGDDDDVFVGPCYHEHLSPVVEVYSVTDSDTGEEIDSFSIAEITVDGSEEELSWFIDEPSYGVELVNGILICENPCGLGTIEGDYVVVVSAEGYLSKTVQFEAIYEEFHGGCPSYNDGATRVAITLDPL